MDLIYWNFLTINKKQNINVFPPYFLLEIKMVLIISFHPYCQRNSGIWKKNAHHWWMFMFIHVNSFTSFVIYKSRIHCKPDWLVGWLVCLFVLFIALKCNGTQAIVLNRSHSHTNIHTKHNTNTHHHYLFCFGCIYTWNIIAIV